jgi:hypothetical protein
MIALGILIVHCFERIKSVLDRNVVCTPRALIMVHLKHASYTNNQKKFSAGQKRCRENFQQEQVELSCNIIILG